MEPDGWLRCPACDVVMVGPRLFGCGHAVCTPCSRAIQEGARGVEEWPRCPVCEAPESRHWHERPVVVALDALCRASAEYPPDADEALAAADRESNVSPGHVGAESAEYDRRVAAFVADQMSAVRAAAWADVTSGPIPPASTTIRLPTEALQVVQRVMRDAAQLTGASSVRAIASVLDGDDEEDDDGVEDSLTLQLVWDQERYDMSEAESTLRMARMVAANRDADPAADPPGGE